MKLYTEEKLRNSMLSMKTYIDMYDESVIDQIVQNHIAALNPIELPTIKEIQKEADMFYRLESYNITFVQGARLVLDKIQEGKNEQQ